MPYIIKKSFRSLWRNKRSYIACILVLTIGMSIFISMFSLMLQIRNGIDNYYQNTNFADAFADVLAIPNSEVEKLKNIEGISDVQGQLAQTVKIDDKKQDKIVSVKLIGIDPDTTPIMNKYQYQGTNLKMTNDIWLGIKFYNFYNLKIGSELPLLINGEQKIFNVNGTVEGPEHIYTTSDDSIISDQETFTIGYVKTDTLERYLNMPKTSNKLSFKLEPGYDFYDVENILNESLNKYGLKSLISRDDHLSNSAIDMEYDILKKVGTVLPFLFFLISVIMLYVMLKRLIEQERGEIGTLKAFGYKNFEIIVGYLIYGIVVAIAASVLGIILAYFLGDYMYNLFQEFFNLQDPRFKFSLKFCVLSILGVIALCCITVYFGAKAVLDIRPAEAMRPEAPGQFSANIKIKSKLFHIIFNSRGIMAIRGILRNRFRSLLTIVSIIVAFALINAIVSVKISVNKMMYDQTNLVETYDMKATIDENKPLNDLENTAKNINGVRVAEGMLSLPVKIYNGNISESTAITGVNQDSQLFALKDYYNNYYSPPKDGLLVSKHKAEVLNIKPGDKVRLESPYLERDIEILVSDVFNEPMGVGYYMDINSLSKMFSSPPIANSIILQVDEDKISHVNKTLIDAEDVTDIIDNYGLQSKYEDNMRNFDMMILVFIVLAFIMSFSAIYNVSRISLAEKQRELATMRILGFTVAETGEINAVEQWILLIIGMLAGIYPAILLKDFLANLFSNDMFTLSLNLSWQTFAASAICCAFSVLLANRMAVREIGRYNLTQVLKERE